MAKLSATGSNFLERVFSRRIPSAVSRTPSRTSRRSQFCFIVLFSSSSYLVLRICLCETPHFSCFRQCVCAALLICLRSVCRFPPAIQKRVCRDSADCPSMSRFETSDCFSVEVGLVHLLSAALGVASTRTSDRGGGCCIRTGGRSEDESHEWRKRAAAEFCYAFASRSCDCSCPSPALTA